MAGLLDPRSTVAGNVTTPAFDQTGYADALENRLKQGFVDLPGVGNVDITPLSRLLMTTSKADVARAATGGGSRQDVMRAAQAQTKLEPLVRVAATGLEMMTPSLFGPLGKLAKIAGKGLDTAPVRDAAASAARALLGPQENRTAAQQAVSFLPRAFLPPAPIAEVSATPAVRKVAPEIRTTLEGAQRKLIGKYGSMAEEADQLLRQYGGEARPEVALALTKAPLAAVEREIEPLQAAADVALSGSARELISKVSAGVIAPDKLPPGLREAAESYLAAATRMEKLRERAASHVDEVLQNAGYNIDAIRKEAKEAAASVHSKLVRQEGATPVVTEGPASVARATAVVDGKPLDLTGGGKGAFDFQPETFASEIEKDLLKRRLDALYRGQAKADPTYVAQADALQKARDAFAAATGQIMRDKDITLTLANSGDARRFLTRLQKQKAFTDKITSLRAKGEKGLADLEATLTPEEKALIGTVRGKLAERNKGLVERGILDPSKVDPTISGERYLPIVLKAGRKEAVEAWDEIVKRAAKNEHPDDVARALGYKDAEEVKYLRDNAPKVELTTTIGNPTTVNVRTRKVPIEEAVQSPKAYYEGVVRPAYIGMARSEQAMLSHDTIKSVIDKARDAGLAEVFDPKLATGGEAAAQANAAARNMVPLSFGEDFAKQLRLTGELPEGGQILVHKDIADMLEAYLNPKSMGSALDKAMEVQNAVVPLYTTLHFKFAPGNLLSGMMYNYMHLGMDGMTKVAANAPQIATLAAKMADNPFAALADPANAKLFAQTLDTPNGKIALGDIAKELAEGGLVGQGIRGAEYASRVGGDLVQQKSWAEKVPVLNLLPKAANITETHNRVQGYVGQRLMGATPQEAAERMLKWQVDYSKPLSPEAKIVRAFAPFFRWFQAQTPNMIKALWQHPNAVRTVGMLPASIERAFTTEQERKQGRDLQTAYQRDMGYVPLPTGDVINNVNLRVPGSRDLSPLDIITKPLTAEHPWEAASDAALKLFSQLFLGPASSAFVQYTSGVDPFTGKETRGAQPVAPAVADIMQAVGAKPSLWTGQYQLPGNVNYFLESVPAIRQLLAPTASAVYAAQGKPPIRKNVRRGLPTVPSPNPERDAVGAILNLLFSVNPQTVEEMRASQQAERNRKLQQRKESGMGARR